MAGKTVHWWMSLRGGRRRICLGPDRRHKDKKDLQGLSAPQHDDEVSSDNSWSKRRQSWPWVCWVEALVGHIPKRIHHFAIRTALCPTSLLIWFCLFLLAWERKRRGESVYICVYYLSVRLPPSLSILLSVCLPPSPSVRPSVCLSLACFRVPSAAGDMSRQSWQRVLVQPLTGGARPSQACGSCAGWRGCGPAVRVPAAAVLTPFLQGTWSLRSLSEVFRPVLWTVWEHGKRECEMGGELCRVEKIGPLFF